MINKIKPRIMTQWQGAFKLDQTIRFIIMSVVFWIVLLAFNPNLYITVDHFINELSDIGPYSTANIDIPLTLLFLSLGFILPSSLFFNLRGQKTDTNINSEDGALFEVDQIDYQYRAAETLIKNKPKIGLRQNIGKTTLTQIAGTDKHLLNNGVFVDGTVALYMTFIIAILILHSFLGLVGVPISLSSTLVSFVAITLALVLSSFLSALIIQVYQNNIIQQVALKQRDSSSRYYCEFDITVSRNLNHLSAESRFTLLVGGVNIDDLIKNQGNAHPKVEKAIKAASILMDNTYSTIVSFNTLNDEWLVQDNADKYAKDVRLLTSISNTYLPKVFANIADSKSTLDIKETIAPTSEGTNNVYEINRCMLAAYDDLLASINKNNNKVLEVAAYYSKIKASEVVGSINEIAKKQLQDK